MKAIARQVGVFSPGFINYNIAPEQNALRRSLPKTWLCYFQETCQKVKHGRQACRVAGRIHGIGIKYLSARVRLLLGAWLGILAGPIVTIVLAWRPVLEERTLQRELPGYYEYMTEVKYRLIPFVW
jgi:hypothetical protein